MKMILNRNARNTDGIFGVLFKAENKVPVAVTLEDDKDYIPPGKYKCRRTKYYQGGYKTFEVTGVEGRSNILFHKGNRDDNTTGCIILGSSFGKLKEEPAVLASSVAFKKFMDILIGYRYFDIEIIKETL